MFLNVNGEIESFIECKYSNKTEKLISKKLIKNTIFDGKYVRQLNLRTYGIEGRLLNSSYSESFFDEYPYLIKSKRDSSYENENLIKVIKYQNFENFDKGSFKIIEFQQLSDQKVVYQYLNSDHIHVSPYHSQKTMITEYQNGYKAKESFIMDINKDVDNYLSCQLQKEIGYSKAGSINYTIEYFDFLQTGSFNSQRKIITDFEEGEKSRVRIFEDLQKDEKIFKSLQIKKDSKYSNGKLIEVVEYSNFFDNWPHAPRFKTVFTYGVKHEIFEYSNSVNATGNIVWLLL
jgi:hypothetical protein